MSVCLGYIEYKVKIYEEVHLEEDPDFVEEVERDGRGVKRDG